MKYLIKFLNFINENKKQSLTILSKMGIRKDDPNYLELEREINKTFGGLNYLGLFTKYHFEQEVSVQELIDLMPWLKDNGNRLPQNPLSYDKFEKLKDDIIVIDNNQRSLSIWREFPRTQKDLIDIENDNEFKNLAIEIHKIGKIKSYLQDISKWKTRKEIIDYSLKYIESNLEGIKYSDILESIKGTKSKIIINDPNDGIILIEVFNYKDSAKLGSANWCISTGESSWESYTKGLRRQFFVWNFNYHVSDNLFQIGFTTNELGHIIHIHDKHDKTLKTNVPSFILDTFNYLDFSYDISDFKDKILSYVNNDNIIDSGNKDILILKIDSYDLFKNIRYTSSYMAPFNAFDGLWVYVIYDFSNKSNPDSFYNVYQCFDVNGYQIIKIKSINNEVQLEKDKDGWFSLKKFDQKLLKFIDKFEFKDVSDYYDQSKNSYLDVIEKYVKGESIKKHSYEENSVYINTSSDSTSTGRYWLFKIGYDSHFNKLINDGNILGYGVSKFNIDKIERNNYYILIDIESEWRTFNFVRTISISDSKIRVNYLDDIELNSKDKVISDLIKDGFIVPKKYSEYIAEYNSVKKDIIYEQDTMDSDAEEFGLALFDYLVEEGEIEPEYDEDDEEVEGDERFSGGLSHYSGEESWKNYLIIDSYKYYDSLYQFTIFSSSYITGRYSGDKSYAIGNDEMADESIEEYAKSFIDSIGGISNLSLGTIESNIDSSYFSDWDDYDYFYDLVKEDPESYLDEYDDKEMTSKAIKEIENLEEKIEIINDHIIPLEDDDDFNIYNKEDFDNLFSDNDLDGELDEYLNVDTLVKKYFEIDDSDVFWEEIEEKDKKDWKFFSKIKDFSFKVVYDLLECLEEKIEEIKDDKSDDDYWEWSDSAIEDKATELNEDRQKEIENDPLKYLEDNHGKDGKWIKDFSEQQLENLVDMDGIISDLIDEFKYDRGNSLSGYDSNEREHNFNNKWYYIYRTN